MVGKNESKFSIVGMNIGECEIDNGQYDSISERFLIDDVFMLVRKQVFMETNGYDPHFFLQFEESDWQLRSKKLGYKIYYTPYAKLWHKVGMSTGGSESPLRHKNHDRNSIILVKKHGSTSQFLKFLLNKIFVYLPKSFVRNSVQNRLDLVIANVKGVISGLVWSLRN